MRLYKYFPAMAAALVVGCSAVFAASADDGDVQIVMPSEPEYRRRKLLQIIPKLRI